jgi:ATP-binding cassette subfamily B (MDR/TAP) protein 1
MKKGKIVEKGTHKELLELNGYYAGLIKEQLAEDEIKNEENKDKDNNNNIGEEENDIDNNEIENNINNNINENEKENKNLSDSKNESLIIKEKENEDKNNIKKEKTIKIERKRIWQLISDHKCDLFIGTISGLLYGSLCPFVGVILGITINSLSSKDPEKVNSEGFILSMIYIIIGVGGGFTIFLKIWKLESLGSVIALKMRKKIIKKYLELHIGYYDIDKNSPGALLTKLSIDTSQLDSLVLNIIGGTVTIISTFLVSIGLGIIYDWKTTLILSLFVPISVFGLVKKEDYMENGREGNKKIQIEAGSFLSECVINTKTIFSFNFQQKAIEIYSNILNSETKNYLKNCIMQGFWVGFGLFCYNLSFAIVYKFSIIFIKNKTLTFQNLNCVITNISNSCDGLTDILRNMGDSAKAKLSFKSVFDTLDTKTQISSFEIDNKEKISPNEIKGKIEFKNVYFSYPTKPNQLILKNISFTINPGEKIGLVGLSGSGKSTIIQLIERFYDINKGEILIDDINIKNYNLYELRKKIGLVNQEPVLFKRNIYENILYGKLNSNDEEILDAAKKADIHVFFDDKNFGKKDNPLSGGEKQRVAIARAFLKNPVIILLDEATSALDKETENEIQKNISELQKGRTCISVAHRLSTIVDSDVIFVMESGKLIEKGTHSELLKLKGKYYTLYKYSGK